MQTHSADTGVSVLLHGVALFSLLLQPHHARGEDTAKPAEIIFRCDFESETWWQEWGRSELPKRTETVAADAKLKFEAHDGKALRIRVDQGGHYGVSLDYIFAKRTGMESEEVYFRYYLRLADDWKPERGGKLPGIGGTYGRAGWGGRKVDGTDGWSARGLFSGQKNGRKVFAEFNTMHVADHAKNHPDSAPVGVDGRICPPPEGWQGVCPTHPGYRRFRMNAFRKILSEFEIDGIWLDYHHSHASWERAVPVMPDTCFCERCLARFTRETKTNLPNGTAAATAQRILDQHKDTWVQWRCDLFTDWVREFRSIVDETRPNALLGTFHCPWMDKVDAMGDYYRAIRPSANPET